MTMKYTVRLFFVIVQQMFCVIAQIWFKLLHVFRHRRITTFLICIAMVAAESISISVVTSTAYSSTQPTLLYLNEPFSSSQLQKPSDWVKPATSSGGVNSACLTASSDTSQVPIPGCNNPAVATSPNGSLELTTNSNYEDGGVAYASAIPSTEGIDLRFDTYQYGGTGADGILFFLAGANPKDPLPPSTLGPAGGHLGYSGGTAGPSGNGLQNGYLGIGFDVYGNFANTSYDGSGCQDPTWSSSTQYSNEVTIRGPGSNESGYCLEASTVANGGLHGSLGTGSTGTKATSMVPAEIIINPTSQATTENGINVDAYSYTVAVWPLGGPKQVLSGTLPNASSYESAAWLNPQTGIPYQLAFGFTGSTGGSNDYHLIQNLQIKPLFSNPARVGLTLQDDSASQFVAGDTVTYTASAALASNGGSESEATSFVDTLPTGVTPSSASGTNWSCGISSQTVNCSYTGSLPISAGTQLPSISITAQVANSASGSLDNKAFVVANDMVVAMAQDNATVVSPSSSPLLGLSITDNLAGDYNQSESISYTATGVVAQAGIAEGDAPSFADTLPTSVTPSSASGTNWSCGISSQTVNCSYTGSLPISAGTTLDSITIEGTISSSAYGGIANSASISSSNASSVTATDYGSVVSLPLYSLTLTDSENGDFTSGALTYTATPALGSSGGTEAETPAYTQTLPTGVTPSSASGTNWSCGISSQTVNCSYTGSLPISAGTTLDPITIDASVSSNTTGTNLSSVGIVNSPDGIAASKTDEAAYNTPRPPVLSIKAAATLSAVVGSSYGISVYPSSTSGGGSINHAPTIEIDLPNGETFLQAPSLSDYSCSLSSSQDMSCNYTGALPVGNGDSLSSITATVEVSSTSSQTLLAAQVFVTDASDYAQETSASAVTTITGSPAVFTLSATTPSSVDQGQNFTYTISPAVSSGNTNVNNSPSLEIELGSNATFVSNPSNSSWSCSLNAGDTTSNCTSLTTLPIFPGTTLSSITANISTTPSYLGTIGITSLLTDTKDTVVQVSKQSSINIVTPPTTTTTVTPTTTTTATPTTTTATPTTTTAAPTTTTVPLPSKINVTYNPQNKIGAVLVSWGNGVSNSNSGSELYTVVATPGNLVCTTTGTSCVISGIEPGVQYSFTIKGNGASDNTVSSQAVNSPQLSLPHNALHITKNSGIVASVVCRKAFCYGEAVVTVARRVYKGHKQTAWKHLPLMNSRIKIYAGKKANLQLLLSKLGKVILPKQTKWWLSHQPKFRMTVSINIIGERIKNYPIYLNKPIDPKRK